MNKVRYTLVEAAERMRVSYRQAKRIWYRYHKENNAGLIHKAKAKHLQELLTKMLKNFKIIARKI